MNIAYQILSKKETYKTRSPLKLVSLFNVVKEAFLQSLKRAFYLCVSLEKKKKALDKQMK